MKEKIDKHRSISESMLWVSLELGAIYWIVDTVFTVFYTGSPFFRTLLAIDTRGFWQRLIVVCFFVIFGSHIQHTAQKRRETEEALHESEERYSSLYNNTPVMLHSIDVNGNLVSVSEYWLTTLGYTRDEVIGRKSSEFLTEASREYAIETVLPEFRKTGSCNNIEYQFVKKNGEVIDTFLSAISEKDENGLVVRSLAVVIDITERKVAQEEINYTVSMLNATLESTADGLLTVDRNGKILKLNQKFVELWRIPESILETRDDSQALAFVLDQLKDPQCFISKVEELYSKPAAESFDVLEFKDGRIFERYSQPQRIENTVVGRVWSFRDVTDRKGMEDALAKSEEKFRKAFYTSPDAVNINRLKDGMYVAVNRGFTASTGFTEEEIIGKTTVEYDIWGDDEDRKRLVAGLLKDGEISNLEAPFRTKHGDVRYALMSASLIDLDGVPHIFSITRDITDRRQSEQALKESEERYRTLIENASDIIFKTDVAGHFTFVNPAGSRISGYEEKEVIGKEYWALIRQDMREDAIKFFGRQFVKGLQNTYNEFPVITKDGREIWLGQNTSLLVENGRSKGFQAMARDITDRKLAEEALRRTEENYRHSLDEFPMGVRIVSKEGETIYTNRAFLNIYGYDSIDELNTTPVCKRYTPESFAGFQVRREKRKRGDHIPSEYEVSIVREDDEIRHLQVFRKEILWDGESRFQVIYKDITDRKRAEKKLEDTLERLRKAVGATIQVMVSAVETRDPYTAGHQNRSANLARAIAMEMGLPQDKIDAIRMAGSIHDIGKLSIPAEILSKPIKLSEIEFALIKEHAHKGFDMLKDVQSPWPLVEIVYQHHERMDGSGYPRNLKGEEICMEARIISVADVVEAMASHRPYRPGLGIDAALDEIEKNSGVFYDIAVADACLRLFREKGFKIEAT